MSKDDESPVIPYEDSDDHEQTPEQSDHSSLKTGVLPGFRVKVTEAVKDGASLQFTVMATRVEGDRGQVVTRQFEDLEWLHHRLVSENPTHGIIVPPLPVRPEIDPKAAESRTRKQLGSDCNVLRPDDFELECKAVEKYLSLMLSHPSFGRDKNLESFLCEKEAPARIKVSKGIIGWISTTIDSARKGQHKDIDDYFSKQREWAAEYGKFSKEMSTNFNKVIQSQWRLTSAMQHFSTALSAILPFKEEKTRTVNKLLLRLSEAVDTSRKELESVTQADEKGFGFELDLLARQLESVKEMLFRRTCLMIEYEDATRAWEKAKPLKKTAAEEARKAAEISYDDCTKNAKTELKAFTRQRVFAVQEGLVAYTEAQMRASRDTYTLLVRALRDIQNDL